MSVARTMSQTRRRIELHEKRQCHRIDRAIYAGRRTSLEAEVRSWMNLCSYGDASQGRKGSTLNEISFRSVQKDQSQDSQMLENVEQRLLVGSACPLESQSFNFLPNKLEVYC